MSGLPALDSRLGRLLLLLARTGFWIASAVLAYALCRRGLTLSDEGDVLTGALKILEGKLPYVDLDMFVTPGAWYLNAGVFALFGPSVIATRIAAAGCLLMTMLVTRRIVRLSAGGLWGDFAAALIAVFAVWAWPAWSWSFYSPWATLLSLGALACTLDWMRSRRRLWLVASGVLLGLAIAFKQNYGVFAALGCAFAVLLDEIATTERPAGEWRSIAGRTLAAGAFLALGGAIVLLPAVLWLHQQGALPAAFELLVLRPFEGFIDSHSIRYVRFGDLWRQAQIWAVGGWIYMAVPLTATPVIGHWPSSALSLVVVLHVLLYWIPVFAFAGFGLRGLLKLGGTSSFADRSLLAITVFAAVYFLGVFPRADFNHLINVYEPVLAMLAAGAAALFGAGRWRRGLLRQGSALAAALLFLCFASVSALWMNGLRKQLWIPLDAPRGGVLLDGINAQMLNDEVRLLRSLTATGEPVFALPNISMIPFLAERPMPTRYHNFYAVHIGHDDGAEAARDIEASRARVVLATYDNFFSDPGGMLGYGHKLSEYLRTHYRPAMTVGNQYHLVLARRDEPIPDAPARDLWTMCEAKPGDFPSTSKRERLLFWSLIQSFKGAWASHNQALTTCQFLVPAEARLRMWLELRSPAPTTEDAKVRSELWLFRSKGKPKLLLENEWTPPAEVSSVSDTAKEFDVDLSRWDGEVVNLMLRTVVTGTVPSAHYDHLGLSVIWNGGRLESPEYAADWAKADEDGRHSESAKGGNGAAHETRDAEPAAATPAEEAKESESASQAEPASPTDPGHVVLP